MCVYVCLFACAYMCACFNIYKVHTKYEIDFLVNRPTNNKSSEIVHISNVLTHAHLQTPTRAHHQSNTNAHTFANKNVCTEVGNMKIIEVNMNVCVCVCVEYKRFIHILSVFETTLTNHFR